MNYIDGCVCCGRYMPEGFMVCPVCMRQMEDKPCSEKKVPLRNYLKKEHQGKEKAVKSSSLESLFAMGDRDIRRCVSALRKEGVPICSDTHNGYYYAKDQDDINATVGRLNDFLTGISNARTGLLYSKVDETPKVKKISILLGTKDGPDEEVVLMMP